MKKAAKQSMHQLQRTVEPGLGGNVKQVSSPAGTWSSQDALAQARSTGMNALKKARALMPATNMKPLRLTDSSEPTPSTQQQSTFPTQRETKPSTQQQPAFPIQPGPTLLGRESQLRATVRKKGGQFKETAPKKGAMPLTALSQSEA